MSQRSWNAPFDFAATYEPEMWALGMVVVVLWLTWKVVRWALIRFPDFFVREE